MNEAKVTEYLGNIFHLETCIGENGNYEISSNYWDLKFNVRIDKTKIIIENIPGGTEQRIYFDDDETSIARSLIAFIGLVLRDKSHNYTYNGTNGILSWPYNCNLAYVDYLKQAMDMGADENIYEYEARKAGLNSSKKPIKSDYHDKEIYREAFASLVKDSDAQDFDNGDYGIAHYPGFYRVLVDGTYETEFSAETDEEAIQKFKDYFANKKKGINNSKKPIKSSDDKPWWEYEDKPDEKPRWWEHKTEEEPVWTEDDEERLRAQYADENGLDLNEDIIDEDDYNEWIHKGAAMYSSKKPIKSSFVENLKKDNGLDYFTVPELQRMNYEKLKNGEITDNEYLENDELITKYKGRINSSRNQSSLNKIFN